MTGPIAAGGMVVQYSSSALGQARDHEIATRRALAIKLAALMGYEYAGQLDTAGAGLQCPLYVVPDHTLTTFEARSLGIRTEHDLFGGVVPYPFVGTKTITHPLVDDDAVAPAGWSPDVGRQMSEVVLDGYSVFCASDARRAGKRLLEHGPVRIKPAHGIGGNDQAMAADSAELDAAVNALDAKKLGHGVVVEQNLADVTTFSVGEACIGGTWIAYYGTQRLTKNHHGAPVYGGSDLFVVRGRHQALLELGLARDAEVAVQHAAKYDAVAARGYEGFFASRRNYDVAQGLDGAGKPRTGVLEQSWRIGGASPAEIAAFDAFKADRGLKAVRASSVEVYGDHQPPANAVVYFSDVDSHVGRITKYSTVESL